MRDSYVADVGDFGKYALLNALAGNDLRLGVLWCRNALEDTSQDGRFTEYPQLRQCDPALHDKLLQISKGDRRSLVKVENSDILVGTTLFYSAAIPASETPCFSRATRDAQTRLREAWFEEGFKWLSKAELVLLDPDTGLATARVRKYHRSAVKYVFANEVTDWLARGQSIILYQHQQRKPLSEQVAEQRKMLGAGRACLAVSFHRLSVRIYYILAVEKHRAKLSERLRCFLASAWGDHFHAL